MSLAKKAIGGSIHRIREFELEKVNLADEFDILQIVGEGWFGKILLTEHKSTQTEMALKALPKAYTAITDFYREFHYGLHLSAHRNIITTYDVAFETAGFYVFSQEYAPLGDLTANVSETGLGELHTKKVARQLAAAIYHIHSRELVHRDIKLDNILVFKSDFSRIKLCDFGETRRVNTIVRRHNEWLPYSPPEVLQIDPDDTYKAITAHDVWQFGIVLFVCLTGCLPWQKAAMDDRRYTRYLNWHSSTLNIAKKPKLFQLISSRAQRMFKRLLEPKLEKRPVSVLEVNKYLEDRWLGKLGAEKAVNGGADERDELCPSMYSFHSSPEEKNQLLYTLTRYGIETTVDRTRKKDRIREWIQSSTIAEDNEEEEPVLDDQDLLVESSDADENGSMKGRHFPERRPSLKSSTPERPISSERIKSKRASERNGDERKRRSKSAHRPSLRNLERKNPFAPQVAAEMQTIAKYASFPNGDPNLGISLNVGAKSDDLMSRTGSSLPSATYRASGADMGNENRQLVDMNSSYIISNLSAMVDMRENVRNSPRNSPGIRNSPDQNIQNVQKLSMQADSGYLQSPPRSPLPPSRKNRDQAYSAQGIQNPNQNYVDSSMKRVPNHLAQNPNLTISFASQLVMQSFKTMQNINTMQGAPQVSNTVLPRGPVYGKDAYEHYGVAHGAIMKRPDAIVTRPEAIHGSRSGSGSRSVSN